MINQPSRHAWRVVALMVGTFMAVAHVAPLPPPAKRLPVLALTSLPYGNSSSARRHAENTQNCVSFHAAALAASRVRWARLLRSATPSPTSISAHQSRGDQVRCAAGAPALHCHRPRMVYIPVGVIPASLRITAMQRRRTRHATIIFSCQSCARKSA